MLRHRETLAAFGRRHRIPIIAGWAPYAESGALLSYGPNLLDAYRRTAYFVDRIIKGTSPAELPVELPATFETVLNRRTARALGLTPSQAALARVDRVVD